MASLVKLFGISALTQQYLDFPLAFENRKHVESKLSNDDATVYASSLR
jgi:hypothetical protein